jgi:hypothetical protein
MRDKVMAVLLHPRWDEISKLVEIFKLFKTTESIEDLARLHGIPAAALEYPTEKAVEKFELQDQVEVPTVAYEKLFFQHYTAATGQKFEPQSWSRFRGNLKDLKAHVALEEWARILGFCADLVRKKRNGTKLFGQAFRVADDFVPLTILNCLNWIRSEISAITPQEIEYGKKI